MTIQAYVDDTGLDGASKVFLFSALLGTALDWADLSDRWSAVLRASPAIGYFKMDEAVGLTGQFYGFSEQSRDDKLKTLAQTLRGRDDAIIEHTLTTDIAVVRPRLRAITTKPLNDPYFWAFQLLIQAIALALVHSADYDEPFEIFFDQNDIFGPRAKAWYPITRAITTPRIRAVMPVEPWFRDDKDTMPLQAADLTAWMSRADSQGSNQFEWLRPYLSGVSKSPYSTKFTDKELGLLFDRGPIPPKLEWKVEAGRKAIEEVFIKGGARHFVPKPQKPKG